MAMLECKCPNCSGVMKVDGDVEKAICPFCGTTMVIAKPINVGRDYIRSQTNIVNNPKDDNESKKELYSWIGMALLVLVIYGMVFILIKFGR